MKRDHSGTAPEAFRGAMARLGAAVHIVTTDGQFGRAGFTATAVCSLSDEPPMLLVCINRKSSAYEAMIGNGVLCVNALTYGHEALARRFSARLGMSERFGGTEWTTLITSAPVLPEALISFDCRIVEHTDGGTHEVLICEVDSIRQSHEGDEGLMYWKHAYHPLSREGSAQ